MKLISKGLSVTCLAFAALASGGSVQAASCGANGVDLGVVGTSSTSDVTHNGTASDACVISAVNPSQGDYGNTSGFSGYDTFGTGWNLLVKHDVNGNYAGGSLLSNGVTFTSTITGLPGTSGTWTLSADQNVTLDLVFAMHGANRSGAFLFNDEAVPGTGNNTWEIHWVNNGGNEPNFSNLALFVRDVQLAAAIPEPESYAMMLAGLGVIGAIVRRRRRR